MAGRFTVNKPAAENELRPSEEKIKALLSESYTFSFQSVRASLDKRSKLFKYTWIVLMTITALYLMSWFSGVLKPYMAASVTGLDADFQLHQIRFLLAFIMLAVGTVSLNYDYFVRDTFIVCAWVQFYFLVTGVLRHARALPEDSLDVLLPYTANLTLILILLLTLIIEESKLQKKPSSSFNTPPTYALISGSTG
jgi:hypothetical protein